MSTLTGSADAFARKIFSAKHRAEKDEMIKDKTRENEKSREIKRVFEIYIKKVAKNP